MDELDKLRYYKNKNCFIDLEKVCAVNLVGFTGDGLVYEVVIDGVILKVACSHEITSVKEAKDRYHEAKRL